MFCIVFIKYTVFLIAIYSEKQSELVSWFKKSKPKSMAENK